MKYAISILLVFFSLHLDLSAQCSLSETTSNASLLSTSFGQSFVPQCTGRMSSFSFVALSATLPLIGTLEVYEGDNVTGTPIYTQSFNFAIAIGTNTINLDESVEVLIKNSYTVELTLSLSVLAAISTIDPYADGQLYASGAAQTGNDLAFEAAIEGVYPGGVSTDLALWLRADANTNSEVIGDAITQWNDLSTNERNYTGAGTNSTLGSGLGDDYPTISLNSNDAVLSSAESTFTDATLYVVVNHSDQPSANNFYGNLATGNNVLKFEQETNSGSYGYTDGSGDNFTSTLSSNHDIPKIISFETSASSNSLNIQTLTNSIRETDDLTLNSTTEVISTQDIGGFGDVAEIVLYGGSNSSADDRLKIESYLSMKYALTPDGDLIATDNTVVWDHDLCLLYSNDIAVIGRDDATSLNVDVAASINSDKIVSVAYDQPLTNLSFMAWGNNNGSVDNSNTLDVDGTLIEVRSDRAWKIEETGTVGAVNISFDLSKYPGSKVATDLRLLIDRDGDGFSDNDVLPQVGTISDGQFTVNNVDFQDGDVFTIGSSNQSQTPLPVTLIDFTADVNKGEVILKWHTASEIDNDYYTIERSRNGTNWENLARIPGSGTTDKLSAYTFIDDQAEHPSLYYRLTQTDFDGTSAHLATEHVTLEYNRANVFPTRFTDYLRVSTNDKIQEIGILDLKGNVVFYLKNQSVNNSLNLDVSDLKSGLYLVNIYYTDYNEQHKILKVSR